MMNKDTYLLAILLFVAFVAIAISVLLAHKCARLSKELVKQKQSTNVKMFNFNRGTIKEIKSIVEIPLESYSLVTEAEIKESLINEMYPELKSCLEYETDNDLSTLTIKCVGRFRIVEVE